MSKLKVGVIACTVVLAGMVAAIAQAAPGDTLGVSTLVQRIFPEGNTGLQDPDHRSGRELHGPHRHHRDHATPWVRPRHGRETRRVPLAYFGQLTDFQLADEESPARVEFLDPGRRPFHLVLAPRRDAEPARRRRDDPADERLRGQRSGRAAATAPSPACHFVMNTGDISDSQQYNETLWNRQLIEGGMINPGSGVDPTSSIDVQPALPVRPDHRGRRDQGRGDTGQLHRRPGPRRLARSQGVLLLRSGRAGPAARRSGQRQPVLGRADPRRPDEQGPGAVPGRRPRTSPATSCSATTTAWSRATRGPASSSTSSPRAASSRSPTRSRRTAAFDPLDLLEPGHRSEPRRSQGFLDLVDANPNQFMAVPPDPDRRLISKKQYMDVFKATARTQTATDSASSIPAEATASNGSAGYYSFVEERVSATSRSTPTPKAARSSSRTRATSTRRSSTGSKTS